MSEKRTALSHIHEALGAKMVPYAGYMMPVQYEGVTAEHINVRDKVGVFDVSHMGEFLIKGDQALELIQKITTNDAGKLVDGKVQYSCFPNGKGGIVDDLLVYRIDEKTYMLVVNASNMEKDWNWIQSNNTMGAELEDISDKTSLLAVQGPNAAKALQGLTDMDLENMVYYTFEKGQFAGHDNVLVSATGYTGAGGFEIYFRWRRVRRMALCPQAWQLETPFDWRWVSVFTETRSTTRHHRSRPDWAGSLSSQRISSTRNTCVSRKKRASNVSWLVLYCRTAVFHDMDILL
jgi:glycine cleavage system T protein